MKKVKLAFGVLTGMLVTSPTLADEAVETLWLDLYSPKGVEFLDVQSSAPLKEGISYLIKITGTFSVWSPGTWQAVCGNYDDAPQYPSSGTQNGKVGTDIANIFALPAILYECSEVTFPIQRKLPINLDGTDEWLFLVPENPQLNSDHAYTYRVVGQGHPMKIRYWDSYMQMDNYGQLKIEIYPDPTCQLYAVHDNKLNDSQLFTVSPTTFEAKALGDIKIAHDLEALDNEPQTDELFAASGKDTDKPGYLYTVNKITGELTEMGPTGFEEIDGLAFAPDGTLWGWATGDGLVTIDTHSAQATLMAVSTGEVEDLAWNVAGTILYGVGNLLDGAPDVGTQLLAYDTTTGALNVICQEQTHGQEIEALDTLPDDTLIFGVHGKRDLILGAIDPKTCQIIASQKITTDYTDVEGVAWPHCQ